MDCRLSIINIPNFYWNSMLNSMAKLKQNFASCLPKAVCYSDLTTVSLGQTNAIYSRSLSLWFDFFPYFHTVCSCQWRTVFPDDTCQMIEFDSSNRTSQAAMLLLLIHIYFQMISVIVNHLVWNEFIFGVYFFSY